jgi:flagellar basal body-associated protein FliL
MKKQLFVIIVILAVMTTGAMAGTQATNTNTVAPTLQVQVNVQKAVRLTLSTGTAAVTHCAVAAGANPPDYTMNFGTVDALGINAGNCNLFAPATPGVSNAIYWSDYNVTPMFTSQSATTNTITAQVTTDFAAPHNVFVMRDSANSSTVPASAAAMAAMGVASADTIATNAASGTALTRYIGVAVTPANGATVLTGNQTATVTFTLTVQ